MLNKVLVFLSEIIYNAWHKVISDLANPPPPRPSHIPPRHSFEVNLWGIDPHNYNFLSFCDTKISRQHIFRGGQDDRFATFKTKIEPLQPWLSRKQIRGSAHTLVTSKTSEVLHPPFPPGPRLQLGAHTEILISAAVQRVCDLGARSTVTKKKKKIPKDSLGS